MSFKFPLGLLGLIGIAILIIIYIIKSKYTEQTIASTYLWTLSEKFLKKRKPISKLTGIITLILQILAIIAVSFLIAQPVFTLKNSAMDICFILDGSASMNMQTDGVSRFDRAKSGIEEIIDKTPNGSSYSLILAGDTTDLVFEGVTDKQQAKANLSSIEGGWCATECADATLIAQSYFDGNPSAYFYLFTDRNYETENIELINVAGNESNFGFEEYSFSFSGNGIRGRGKVISYFSDADIIVEMFAADDGVERYKAGRATVSAQAGVPVEFEIVTTITSYSMLELTIANSDSLSEDNSVILYDEAKAQERTALIVSGAKDSAYIYSALQSAGKTSVKIVEAKDYSPAMTGYGLYVFNGYTPEYLPTNAAIWLINAIDGSGSGSGITYRDMQVPRDEEGPNSYYLTSYTKGSSTIEKTLTSGLIGRNIAVRKYARYGVPRNFTTVMSVGSDPVITVGLNENNDRQVVFAFAIGDSELGLSDDFLVLVRNLTNYSFPSVIDGTVYTCGETMNVNVVPGCVNITVTSPFGKNTTLDTVETDICEVQLLEAGTYTINVKLITGTEMVLKVYASVPAKESGAGEEGIMLLNGEKEYNLIDGYYDDLLAFFIVLAVLMLADWGVYCYEQYQLR